MTSPPTRKSLTRSIWGWAFYDWANSAFATTVMAGFFPLFFKNYWSQGADVNESTAMLGIANSLGGLIVVILAPLLGAIADHGGAKKKFLIFFAYLGALMTAALFTIEQGQWLMASLLYVLGVIGFSGANTFYDALITDVADEAQVDYVSGLGYGMGYLGGGLLFTLNVLMTQFPQKFGLADAATAVRVSFLTVAIWWAAFTVLTIIWVKETPRTREAVSILQTILHGLRQLASTFKKLSLLKNTFLFLSAYWLYIDGVDTIIRMAVDYGKSLGFGDRDLIVALLIVQFVGFPSAVLYGKLGEKWGGRPAIFLAIGAYMAITLGGVVMTRSSQFYYLAVAIGLVQGGIQALSRSYYSRIIPAGQAGEFFGFYNMIGKFAVIIGPALMGAVGLMVKHIIMEPNASPEQLTLIAHTATRWSMVSVLLLFAAGALLFYFVDEEEARAEIRKLEASAE